MAFEINKSKASAWLKDNNVDWALTESVAAEQKMVFKCNSDDRTFYIICPDAGQQTWSVWSDHSKVLPHLDSVVDFVTSDADKTIEDILVKIMTTFKRLAALEDDDEDDYDMDTLAVDYYDRSTSDVETGLDDFKVSPVHSSGMSMTAQAYSGNPMAINRLLRDMKALQATGHEFGVEGGPINDNIFLWEVKLTNFPEDSLLGKDLQEFARKYNCEAAVLLELSFPDDYPMSPPFARIRKPKFQFLTGHVTIGGSICMEVLTKSGWTPTNDIETLLVQIRSEIISDSRARLDKTQADSEYSEREAKLAFQRMVQKYGWS